MVGDASPLTSPAPPAPPIAVTLEGVSERREVKSCLLRALQEQREDRLLEALLHCDRSLKANPSHKRVGKEEGGEDLCDTPSRTLRPSCKRRAQAAYRTVKYA